MVDSTPSHFTGIIIKTRTEEEIKKMLFTPHKGYAELENFKANEDTYFKSEYQKVVRAEKDPFVRELYQIIRRY
jgi:hypothetical protein